MFEDVVPESASHYDSLEYIRINAFGNHELYEHHIKAAIYDTIGYDGQVTEEGLETWVTYHLQYDFEEVITEIRIFKPNEAFKLSDFCAEVEIVGESLVSPYRSVIHFSSLGSQFVIYLEVWARFMLEYQQHVVNSVGAKGDNHGGDAVSSNDDENIVD